VFQGHARHDRKNGGSGIREPGGNIHTKEFIAKGIETAVTKGYLMPDA
jgi:hypothetical protein